MKTFYDFGFDPDPLAFNREAIQAAMTHCGSTGELLEGPEGRYRLDGPLYRPAGLKMRMAPTCVLERCYASSGKGMAVITQENVDKNVNGSDIRGGVIDCGPEGIFGGGVYSRGNNCHWADMEIINYNQSLDPEERGGAQGLILRGDDCKIVGMTVRCSELGKTQTGTGAIRYVGGSRSFIVDCDIECGDDGIAAATATNPDSGNFNRSIIDLVISRNRIISHEARMIVIGQGGTQGVQMSCEMKGIYVSDITGASKHGRAFNIKSRNSRSKVERIVVSRLSVNKTDDSDDTAEEVINIVAEPLEGLICGGIGDVLLDSVAVHGSTNHSAVGVRNTTSVPIDLTLQNGHFQGAGPVMFAEGPCHLRSMNNLYRNLTPDAPQVIRLGDLTADKSITSFVQRDDRIEGIPETGVGVRYNGVTDFCDVQRVQYGPGKPMSQNPNFIGGT